MANWVVRVENLQSHPWLTGIPTRRESTFRTASYAG